MKSQNISEMGLWNPANLTAIISDLVNKYEDISFVRFVEYVLEGATKNNCFDRSSACQINEHFRQVSAQHVCVKIMEIYNCFSDPTTTTVIIVM